MREYDYDSRSWGQLCIACGYDGDARMTIEQANKEVTSGGKRVQLSKGPSRKRK